MGVLAAENAIGSSPLIGTLLGHVPKLLAVATLDRRVVFGVVARHLVLQTTEHVVFGRQHRVLVLLSARLQDCLVHLAISCIVQVFCAFSFGDLSAKVHITLDCSPRNDEVRVTLGIDRRYVVVVIVSGPVTTTAFVVVTLLCTF